MKNTPYLEKRDRYLMAQARHQLYDQALVFERGKMDLLWDVDGKQYIDCFSGIMVVNFGHCNADINAAIAGQLEKLQHVSTFFLTPQMLELAERLSTIMPGDLTRSFFVNSGSEAVDGAILLARAHTGNRLVMPIRYAYHGRTLLAAACTNVFSGAGDEARARDLGIHYIDNAYCYRCRHQGQLPDCHLACARAARAAIELALGQSAEPGIAAILVEPIQGVGGVIRQADEYLLAMQDLAHEYGGLLIVDEVQSGFGRTGALFYTSTTTMQPDIFCMAKGMANGMPLGAFSARDAVAEAIKVPTFSTFGGNPLASAAALAAIDYMVDQRIPERAQLSGRRFMAAFQEMATRHELIGDIRGAGLFLGLELVRDRQTKEPAGKETLRILDECRRRGLIVGKSGPYTNVLRIGPPLVITDAHIDQAITILDEVFGLVEAAR
jgi:4-aminobutyrate aminotransferase-like enzyme